MEKIELCVLLDEYEEVKGTFEIEYELCELVDYYILEITKEIQANYIIDEQLVYHFESLGKLSKFYNIPISNVQDIKGFLKIYNEIAPVKFHYEIVKVEDEIEEQNFIEYINETENGFQKYKDNNYRLPTSSIVVTKPDKETPLQDSLKMTSANTERNIEDMLTTMIKLELYSLNDEYSTEEMMFEKTDYFRYIFEICYKIKDNITSKYNLLLEFQKVYNNEYPLKEQAITIEFK
ncbi:hypothetical protein [Staphylococcus shinii]|uniref:hypothetical protein n=1 Tax=Staphylococcus shinii TaxID=2912228 RepID=UPI003F5699F7